MDIQSVACHVEFYTAAGNQVEHYRMPGTFICPRQGERIHLHQGSLTMDITRVVHDFVEHEGAQIRHTIKIFGNDVAALE